jgi:DNA-binding NarL/FixJ family response regulator
MKDKQVYNLMIVDDHALFRHGLKLLLNSQGEFKVVSEASNGVEFLKKIEIVPVDVVLLDIAMPEMNGLEAAAAALKKYPELKIIALSMYGDEEYYNKMLETGVCGFLLKESSIDEVCTAIRSVIDGKSYFSQELLQTVIKNITNTANRPPINYLSEREIEIVTLICQGFSNQEIAEKLFLGKRTVEKHRANILLKTETKNTAGLVMFAIKNRIVEVK